MKNEEYVEMLNVGVRTPDLLQTEGRHVASQVDSPLEATARIDYDTHWEDTSARVVILILAAQETGVQASKVSTKADSNLGS